MALKVRLAANRNNRIKRIPRALAHPSTPPPWSQNPRKRPRTRKQYLPAPAPIVTPSITSPPGYPRLLASARREPIEPAQWPPSPTIRGDAGFSLDARRGRDRIAQSSQRLSGAQHFPTREVGNGDLRCICIYDARHARQTVQE